MEAHPLYTRGREWKLYILAEGDREFAREFVQGLEKNQQDQVKALLKRVAEHGLPSNIQQFRRFHDHPNLAEFKRSGVRLICFFDGPGRIVITHGFKEDRPY